MFAKSIEISIDGGVEKMSNRITSQGQANKVIWAYKKKSVFWDFWKQIKHNKAAMFGMILITIIVLMAILGPVVIPYEKAIVQDSAQRLQSPSLAHWFGTDNYGRDIFARIVHGAKYSLMIGVVAVAVGISLGCILGTVSGYFGGVIDNAIMRVTDCIVCIPSTLLALTIVAALGGGLGKVLIALIIANIPVYTRVIRSTILNVTESDYIQAAKASGTPDWLIIIKHVLPNAIGVIIVQASMTFGDVIITASTMSFLGLGIQPPTPEWGSMLAEGRGFMLYSTSIMLFPGLAIVLTALALNLMGDGLRDALDPRLRN